MPGQDCQAIEKPFTHAVGFGQLEDYRSRIQLTTIIGFR